MSSRYFEAPYFEDEGMEREEPVRIVRDDSHPRNRERRRPSSYKNCDEMFQLLYQNNRERSRSPGRNRRLDDDNSGSPPRNKSPNPWDQCQVADFPNPWMCGGPRPTFNHPTSYPDQPNQRQPERDVYSRGPNGRYIKSSNNNQRRRNGGGGNNGNYLNEHGGDLEVIPNQNQSRARGHGHYDHQQPRRGGDLAEANGGGWRRPPGNLKRRGETLEEVEYTSRKRVASSTRQRRRTPSPIEFRSSREVETPNKVLFHPGAGFNQVGPRRRAYAEEENQPDYRNGGGGGIPWERVADFPRTPSRAPSRQSSVRQPGPSSSSASHGRRGDNELERKLQRRRSRWGTQLDHHCHQPLFNPKAANDVNLALDEVVDKRQLTYQKKVQMRQDHWAAPQQGHQWKDADDDAPGLNGHHHHHYRQDDEPRRRFIESRLPNPRERIRRIAPPRPPATATPPPRGPTAGAPRPIVIDGSNVAHEYAECKYKVRRFECKGIRVCVDWFLQRGFTDVTVVVPLFRMQTVNQMPDGHILKTLKQEGRLMIGFGRQLSDDTWVYSDDDKMIIAVAHTRGGIIVSRDRYRNELKDHEEWRSTIRGRVLPFLFTLDMRHNVVIHFDDDPMGKDGPTLDQFLRF